MHVMMYHPLMLSAWALASADAVWQQAQSSDQKANKTRDCGEAYKKNCGPNPWVFGRVNGHFQEGLCQGRPSWAAAASAPSLWLARADSLLLRKRPNSSR